MILLASASAAVFALDATSSVTSAALVAPKRCPIEGVVAVAPPLDSGLIGMLGEDRLLRWLCLHSLRGDRLSLGRQEVCRVSLSGDSELGSPPCIPSTRDKPLNAFLVHWVLEFFAVRGMVLLLLTNISFSLSLWYVPYDQHETLTKGPEKLLRNSIADNSLHPSTPLSFSLRTLM